MNRFLSFLLVICLLSLPCLSSAEDSSYTDARGTADFMQEHYGITILIGPECKSVKTGNFTIGDKPAGRSPFLEMLGGKPYSSEIKMIDDAFSIYPPGFFEKFRTEAAPYGLRILLADQIIYKTEEHIAGVTTEDEGYYNIFLGLGAFNDLNIHHEIWHAMELRILEDDPHVFDHWNDLNPEGFTYDAFLTMNKWEQVEPKDEWFVRGHSTIDEMEDRATVIEAVFQHDSDWWDKHTHIQKKLEALLNAAEPIFGTVYYHE